MGESAHIAVVDDEPDIRGLVQNYLTRHGFAVSQAEGGAALRALMAERPVDLVILDVNMPEQDGVSIARELRAAGRVGIIMLTANSDSVDKVVGLEVGADDYVTKPFDPRELLARVRSVLRRAATPEAPAATLGREVVVGEVRLNLDSRKMFAADGSEMPLTAMEFDLLRTFVEHPNRVLTRDQLLDLAHSKEPDVFDRSVDTRIVRLRQKVEKDPRRPQALKTVRGAGYMFVPARTGL
ncbi:response regulator [Sphingomonas piscis]|uniref:Regulatory protein VirG n=1 Tax=Sphingomonas piscis TaxID=2714943 RepID=A0A6G7YQZ5_9SPHN|nr:response regulator [Sphingomonas piscis]QIK79165.1 response regulator [Sphingomonas piscis]